MRKLILPIALTLLASVAISAATRSKKSDITKSVDIFSAVMKEIQTFYVDTIDAQKSTNIAINSMLSQLDPYTEYFPLDEKEQFKSLTSGEYAGIGSYIMQRNKNVYISGPYENSPAARAGLKTGDLIVTIDGDTMLGLSHDKVSERLKGTPGTQVVIGVKRPYVADSMQTITVTREKISIPSVPYAEVRPDGVGYIMLTSYTEKSPDEIRAALDKFKKDPSLKGIVLDLRENGGGYLESAVEIVGFFVPKGTEVLRTRGKGLLDEKVYKTPSKPIMPDIPLVVLINENTASAAEITAGALQDLDRAVVMGNRSFGKGLVQTTRQLPHDGMLKVTMARYYIPSGRLIQAIDYSHRNPDGSVARIPDSLTTAYKTAAGRIVHDGGGITPDIKIKYPELSRLTVNVVNDNWAFDYANLYAATHASIPPAKDFTITDSIYADFKSTIDPQKFNYDKVCETLLERLREVAKIEGYASDSLNTQFDRLGEMMKHSLSHDLDTHRKAIEPFLEKEIASRYYYRTGEIEAGLRSDPGIAKASELLANPKLYKETLAPKK